MISRGLLLCKIAEEASPQVTITIDSPTHGVVIMDIAIGGWSTPTPLHWRAGDWTKPPLDFCLNSDGRLESIQVVFQDEVIETADVGLASQVNEGVPSFDVSDWPSSRYLDERSEVQSVRLASNELNITLGNSPPHKLVRVGEGLGLGLDDNSYVVQVVIGPLDAGQWRLIRAAAAAP
jgi:hypothetical protein